MAAAAGCQYWYKRSAADWGQRQQLTPQQADQLQLQPNDTLTLSREADMPGEDFFFYFPRAYAQASWQQARHIFAATPELYGVTLKRQREGCYRLRFWHAAMANVNPVNILASIRALAPADAAQAASNGCPFYQIQRL